MRLLIILGLTFSLIGCEEETCRERAKVIGVDESVCGSYKARKKVRDAYHEYAEGKVDQATRPSSAQKKIQELTDKIKQLELELKDCEERLAGASGMGCDIPANMPPPPECDCERWKR